MEAGEGVRGGAGGIGWTPVPCQKFPSCHFRVYSNGWIQLWQGDQVVASFCIHVTSPYTWHEAGLAILLTARYDQDEIFRKGNASVQPVAVGGLPGLAEYCKEMRQRG